MYRVSTFIDTGNRWSWVISTQLFLPLLIKHLSNWLSGYVMSHKQLHVCQDLIPRPTLCLPFELLIWSPSWRNSLLFPNSRCLTTDWIFWVCWFYLWSWPRRMWATITADQRDPRLPRHLRAQDRCIRVTSSVRCPPSIHCLRFRHFLHCPRPEFQYPGVVLSSGCQHR